MIQIARRRTRSPRMLKVCLGGTIRMVAAQVLALRQDLRGVVFFASRTLRQSGFPVKVKEDASTLMKATDQLRPTPGSVSAERVS